jgi:hypothetical protein
MKSRSKATPSLDQSKKPGILVVGDWFVDEHWATGHHRSGTASRSGRTHQRSLHKPSSAVQSLCGAGRTASVLYRAKQNKQTLFEIYGIGMWDEQDTDILEEMLDPENHAGHTPFRIKRVSECKSHSNHLFTLSRLPSLKSLEHGTEHIIRTYRPCGGKYEVSERIDWILTPSRDNKRIDEWISNDSDLYGAPRFSAFNDSRRIVAVVIKDHARGVISSKLIHWINSKLPGIPWFVSTKSWVSSKRAAWLNELKYVDLRVLMIPQVPSQNAVRRGELGCWLTNSGWVTNEAFSFMDQWHAKYFKSNKHSIVIVLPHGCSVIAREQRADNAPCGWIQHLTEPGKVVAPVPMASVFLGALVGHYMTSMKANTTELLKQSLAYTHAWMEHESQRIANPETWKPEEEPRLISTDTTRWKSISKWEPLDDWNHVTGEWKQAWVNHEPQNSGNHSKGIIVESAISSQQPPDKRIELWRAMTDLDGYVCVVESKRKAIRRIVTELDRFCRTAPTTHVSCMVVSEPGAGKTYLARRLAESLGMRYRPFNITQMLSREDLVKCFDKIASIAQTLAAHEPLLVFIDEINAKLDGDPVYGSFLAPLEERVFIQYGQPHPIPPCAWLFAGTTDPNKEKAETKGPDFYSRLTVKPVELRVEGMDEVTEAQARLENVYLGVSLIRASYPDVRFVSEKIIDMFHGIPPANERKRSRLKEGVRVRDVEQFVRMLDDIQYGQVTGRNVRDEVLREVGEKLGINFDRWRSTEDGSLVKIIG